MSTNVRSYAHWLPALIVAIALVAILIGGITLHYVETSMVASAGESLTLAAADIADKLIMLMVERYGDIQQLSQSLEFQGRDRAAMTRRLFALLEAYPVYRWAGVTDAEGRVLAATDRTNKSHDLSGEPGFLAVREGKHAVVHVTPADDEGSFAVTFAAPLHDARGTFMGMVMTQVGLPVLEDTFVRGVNTLQAQRGTEARIEYLFLDHDGNVFVDSFLREQGQINLKQLGVPSAQLFDESPAGFIEERHARRQVEVVTGYAQTKGTEDLKDLRWGVLVRVDRSDILVPIRILMWKIGAAGSAIFLPLLGVLFWSITRLSRSREMADEERNRAQAAECRFRTVLEMAPDVFIMTDIKGNIVLANQQADRMFGYTPGQLIGQPVEILVPEAVRDVHRTHREHYHASPQTRPMGAGRTLTGRRQDGTEFPIQASLGHIQTAEGSFAVAILRDLSQERMQQAERERLNHEIHLLLDSTIGGLYGLDGQGRCTFINRAGADLLGYQPDELLGRDLHELVHHSYEDGSPYPIDKCPLYRACQGGQGCQINDEVLWRRDGTAFPSEIASRPVYEAGVLKGAVVTFADITERKRAEEEIRTRAAWQKAVMDYAGHAIISTTPDGVIQTFNPAAERMLGYKAKDVVGKVTPAVIHDPHEVTERAGTISEELGERIEPGFEVFVAKARRDLPNDHEWTYIRKDGTRFPVWLSVTALKNATGNITGFLGLAQDITEREQAEKALRESNERLRVIVDTALDAVITMDMVGNIIAWNAQAETVFGWTRQEAMNRTLSQLIVPPQHREAHTRGLKRYLADGVGPVLNTRIEITALRKNGEEFPVELAITPVRVGNAVFFSAFLRDITERKQFEAQLLAAKELAESSARAKSEFLATMSHEIRTPMNGVIGMTGLLLDTALTPEQREFAETVRRSGDHLLTVINDILDFSKIEAGKMNMEIIDFDLRTAVDEAVDLLAERASSKGLHLARLFHADVPAALRGDPGRLRQILLNLVGNAIKFTERGEVVLSVTLAHHTETDATVRFEVQDTGIGLSPETQGHLFQSFSQADSSTTRKFGGTGLGLAICKQLTELMGGHIGVESRLGEGSTFWFTAQLGKQPQGTASSRAMASQDLHGLQLCIVDDSPVNRRLLELYARRWEVRCLIAEDGQQALALLRKAAADGHACELAIIDMQLPGMNGLELAGAIKADPLLAATKIVLLTSQGQRGDAKAAYAAGCAAYLSKPVQASQLYECLTTVLRSSAQATAREGQSASPAARPELVTRHTLAEMNAQATAKILLAEDNVVNQKVAVRMLEKLGYRVDLVANGLEVLDALARTSYAAVLMDCHMPEMDGFAAAAEIRRQEGADSHLPIIAMTANVLQEGRDRCLAAGMDDYLSKPVQPKVLAEVLARWVSAPAPNSNASDDGPLQAASGGMAA